MKNFIFTIVLFSICFSAYNQQEQTEIKKSNEKVLIDGKVYYIHIVLQGQTAYSISRAYNVTVQDIVVENPGVNLIQLKPGQKLKIPEIGTANKLVSKYYGFEDNDFTYHEVKKGQTVFFLSRKYNVPVQVIYKFNPGSDVCIKEGQTIRIPKKKVLKEAIHISQDTGRYVYYEAKKKDTLYSLAVLYGVTVADIINSNPELRLGLKAGQIIRIPKVPELFTEAANQPADSIQVDTIIHFYSRLKCDSVKQQMKYSKQMKVALLLPFFADMTMREKKLLEDTLNSYDYYSDNSNQVKPQLRIRGGSYYEFYEGVLMAIDTLKDAGVNISLQVFDTEKDTLKTKKIVTKLSADMPDLIIGPVFPENIKIVKKFASEHDVLLVSPLYNRPEQLMHYHGIFQMVPSRDTENDALKKYVLAKDSANIIIIYDSDTLNNKESVSLAVNLYDEISGDTLLLNRSTIKKVVYSDTIIYDLMHNLSLNRQNQVLVLSNNEAFVSVVLSRLVDRSLKLFDINVLGQSSWLSFKNIEIEYLHNLGVTIFTPFFIDYEDSYTLHFLQKFRDYYGLEPNEIKMKGYNLAFLGYDITFYFANAFRQYGFDCTGCLNHLNTRCLMSKYSFEPVNSSGGFENIRINLIRYSKKNYTVTKIFCKENEIAKLPSSANIK